MKEIRGIIDRFEGDFAVVEFEGRVMKDIPRSNMVSEVKEGDVIFLVDGIYYVDVEETLGRKNEIAKLMENMWE